MQNITDSSTINFLTAKELSNQTVTEIVDLSDKEISQAVQKLVTTMKERLAVMDDVAKWKWNHDKPVEDLPREAAILERLGQKSEDKGIDRSWAKDFFQVQMDAAKMIQKTCIEKWKSEEAGMFTSVPDLVNDIRPKLDKLTDDLFCCLQVIVPHLNEKRCQDCLNETLAFLTFDKTLTPGVYEKAMNPLHR